LLDGWGDGLASDEGGGDESERDHACCDELRLALWLQSDNA